MACDVVRGGSQVSALLLSELSGGPDICMLRSSSPRFSKSFSRDLHKREPKRIVSSAWIRPDSFYERPLPERHRINFYLGHLEAFDWNLLRERVFGLRAFSSEFDRLFAFGIDPVDGGLPSDQPGDWPSLEQTREYNMRVRQAMDGRFESALASGAKRENEISLLLNVAIEHRLMHAETLAYILHRLPLDRKLNVTQTAASPSAPPHTSEMVEIPGGSATLGLAREDDSAFGWDNEYEVHKAHVPAFAIDRYKITNGEYLKFMTEGGYTERSLWTGAGWQWKTGSDISHPLFWQKKAGQWYYLTMFNEVPLPFDWPVYVSHAEASAYARWAGKALPTEAQWHRAAFGSPGGQERPYPWGSQSPGLELGNFDFNRWDPVPVSSFPRGRSAFAVAGMVGNGWEWTSSRFEPFPGFQPFPFYAGYSANFYDGHHFVLKGGSARTAACMLRRSFRNWFQPHYPYVYAAFRCVRT